MPEEKVAVAMSGGIDSSLAAWLLKDAGYEVVGVHLKLWADPDYELIHSSIVDCHRNLLGALRNDCQAETTGDDNLRTLELVFGAYESAEKGTVVKLN